MLTSRQLAGDFDLANDFRRILSLPTCWFLEDVTAREDDRGHNLHTISALLTTSFGADVIAKGLEARTWLEALYQNMLRVVRVT